MQIVHAPVDPAQVVLLLHEHVSVGPWVVRTEQRVHGARRGRGPHRLVDPEILTENDKMVPQSLLNVAL